MAKVTEFKTEDYTGDELIFHNPNIEYKFDEDIYIDEVMDYITDTYGTHYSVNNFQATEFIIDGGHGEGFCIGNILKYAQRYGKKGSRQDARKDLMKVLHYAIIQLYVHDQDDDS